MSDNNAWKTGTAAALTAGVVGQFFVQPLLPYFDPTVFFVGGLALAIGLAAWPLTLSSDDRYFRILAILGPVIGLGTLGFAQQGAMMTAEQARSHCRKIERAMLIPPKDVRPDLPETFTALGCRPQL